MCRILYTLETGEVASKRAALEWAVHKASPAWHDLIHQAIADRPVPWDGPPRPGSVEATLEFTEYAQDYAGHSRPEGSGRRPAV
jgi:hypothetical protein